LASPKMTYVSVAGLLNTSGVWMTKRICGRVMGEADYQLAFFAVLLPSSSLPCSSAGPRICQGSAVGCVF
jgi:hypothetical protein